MTLRLYRPWLQEDIELLRQLAETHARVNAIARRLGRTACAVRAKAFKEGISLVAARVDLFR